MSETLIVAIISLIGTLVGTFAGIMTSTKLSNYRIEQLEKKVEKHNNVVERTALIEQELKSVWHTVDEIREEIHILQRDD